MTAFGAFAGGFADSIQSGIDTRERAEERAIRRGALSMIDGGGFGTTRGALGIGIQPAAPLSYGQQPVTDDFSALGRAGIPPGQLGELRFAHEGQDRLDPALDGILRQSAGRFGPLTVTSGFRDAEYNSRVGGSRGSHHVAGRAADIDMSGMNDAQRRDLVMDLAARGGRGFITYTNTPDMLHVDMGGGSRPNIHFMHDRSHSNISRAPAWMQDLAGQYQGLDRFPQQAAPQQGTTPPRLAYSNAASRGALGDTGPRLTSLIDRTEGAGNYSTLFGHSQRDGRRFEGVDVTRMSVGDVIQFSNPQGAYGRWVRDELGRSGQRARIATPMGRYQIVGTTLRNAVQELGIPTDSPFDARTQDMIAVHLARRRLASASSIEGKRRALRNEWEGLQHVSDADLNEAIRELERNA